MKIDWKKDEEADVGEKLKTRLGSLALGTELTTSTISLPTSLSERQALLLPPLYIRQLRFKESRARQSPHSSRESQVSPQPGLTFGLLLMSLLRKTTSTKII